MGIKRTSDPNDAVTDMAVMNMSGGYSFEDYKFLVNEKKAEINEFMDSFMPVLSEYRDNYNGKGSAAGKARAQLAHDLLNRFYDGEIDGEYAVNDTGKPLGDLLLNKSRREYGEDNYDALSKNDRVQYGDLQQILMESTGSAVLAVEQALMMAADTSDETWLDRLADSSYMEMRELAEFYAGGNSSLSDLAAESLLQSKIGDTAAAMASGYKDVQQDLNWYTAYMDQNGLWQTEAESDEAYNARMEAYLNAVKTTDESYYEEVAERISLGSTLYAVLDSTAYEGDWGDTLLDFFLPEDHTDYSDDGENFFPFAAVLSDGQRAGMELLSLKSLLLLGAGTEDSAKQTLPKVQELFGDASTFRSTTA